jgi:sulfite reductase alpha subunit-like flavoprotein
VLYGSQTGNAESICTELAQFLAQAGIENKCMKLNDAKKLPLRELASCLVIACSTTGNGDAPENADGWWRSVKLRSTVSSVPR